MNYTTQILFFFGAIGVFNSLMVSVYLLVSTSRKNLTNRLFGLFLLLLSLRVLLSLFYAFSTGETVYLIQTGPFYFLLIGPLFLAYISSYVKPHSFKLNHWRYHILIWLLIVILLMIFLPFRENVALVKKTLLPLINLQWLVYLAIAGLMIKSTLNHAKTISTRLKWIIILWIGILIIWVAYFLLKFDYFVIAPIMFSIIFYTIFIFFLFNKKISLIIFEKTKKKKPVINSEATKQLINRLNELITSKKLYTNPKLKLSEIAQEIDISTHELSKLMNEHVGTTFLDYINKFRIEEAKQLIKTNSKYTIEAIGNQAGFNSKSAFYKAFKKFTNVTPAKYKSQL